MIKTSVWRVIRALRLERAMLVLRSCRAVKERFSMLRAETFGRRSEIPRRFSLRSSGSAVYLRPRSSDLRVFHEIFCYRGYELPERARRALSRLPAAVDAGANIGLFTLFLCECVPGLKVTAFEPDPDNASLARRTLASLIANGQVDFIEAAVGTFNGLVPFLTGLGMTSRRASPGERSPAEIRQCDLFERLDSIGLLKLDIEGAEWDLLRDPRWPVQMPPCLVMEWHGLHDDVREQAPTVELRRLLATADEITDVVFDPGVVGHLWAFRELPPGHDQRQEHPAAPELRDEDEAQGIFQRLGRGVKRVRSWIHARPGGAMFWRVGVALVGLVVIIVGIILLAAPGPGWLVIFLGLGIWATEFVWAESLLRGTRRTVRSWTAWLGRQPRWVAAVVGAVGLIALAAVATAGWFLFVKQ